MQMDNRGRTEVSLTAGQYTAETETWQISFQR
jgi:hypothetical protein